MIVPLLCGAGIGIGLLLVLTGLFPRRRSLADDLAGLRAAPAPHDRPHVWDDAGWATRLGAPAVPWLIRRGLPRPRAHTDLAVLGRPVELHLAEQTVAALTGLFFPVVIVGMTTATGTGAGWILPVWLGPLLGVAGWVLPSVLLHRRAEERRADFRHALSAWIDLVVVSLAGGAGLQSALHTSAATGQGWAFTRIRAALNEAAVRRNTSPWAALAEHGTELGIPELSELAAALTLAGTQGAAIRATLRARAAALRTHLRADLETAGAMATERMSLAAAALFAGFLLFIGYPALTTLLEGL